MRVLLDNNVNYRFGRLLKGHEVVHVQDIGWDKLRNGELLAAADRDGFEVMITADKRMQYQQRQEGQHHRFECAVPQMAIHRTPCAPSASGLKFTTAGGILHYD